MSDASGHSCTTDVISLQTSSPYRRHLPTDVISLQTSSPYSHGDLVTYRCLTGFTMSGVPSQLCSSGSWSGTAPTCTPISLADLHEQTVEVTNDSGDAMMYGMIVLIAAVFLIMLTLLIVALCVM
ncbi:hypothetical protein ACOMHN_010055 [Nucella lapillus]